VLKEIMGWLSDDLSLYKFQIFASNPTKPSDISALYDKHSYIPAKLHSACLANTTIVYSQFSYGTT